MSTEQEDPTKHEQPPIEYRFEDYDEQNRRLRHETAYPQVSILFDEETVQSMNWRAVFGF